MCRGDWRDIAAIARGSYFFGVDEEERTQERLAKRFAKRARMQRLVELHGDSQEFSQQRLIDEDESMKLELSKMKVSSGDGLIVCFLPHWQGLSSFRRFLLLIEWLGTKKERLFSFSKLFYNVAMKRTVNIYMHSACSIIILVIHFRTSTLRT